MIRVKNIEKSKEFFCDLLGKYTLVFLAAPNQQDIAIELTHNWDTSEIYSEGRNFGHLAFEVSNIYEICEKMQRSGVTINRPPRDGRMAFVRSPDNISIELLQMGNPLELKEPWKSMENIGYW
jgi:lactoylglutathione lyase